MASNLQPGCAKRKRSPSPAPSPLPSQSGGGGGGGGGAAAAAADSIEGDDGIANEKSASTDDSSSDNEDPLEECKRRVPENGETRILISQLKLFEITGLWLRQKEEENREAAEKAKSSSFTPGSVSDTSTLKQAFTPKDDGDDDVLGLKLTFSKPEENFRSKIDLPKVKIYVHTRPRAEVRAKISQIVHGEVSDDERAILDKIAVKLHNSCMRVIRTSSDKGEVEVEDEAVKPFQVAFRSVMPVTVRYTNHENIVGWLGPKFKNNDIKKASIGHSADVGNGESSQMSEENEPSTIGVTPGLQDPGTTLTGPAPSPVSCIATEEMVERFQVKTPLASLTEATALTSFVTKFSSSRSSVLSGCRAVGPYSVPSPLATNLADFESTPQGPRFFEIEHPFAFVEDKGYVGVKQLREAEDRTALIAAIALFGLVDCEEKLRGSTFGETRLDSVMLAPPLFFSFAIQGPAHELWVHWSTQEQGLHTFHSKMIDSYNVQQLHRAAELVTRMANIALWGSGPFLDLVSKQLSMLATTYG